METDHFQKNAVGDQEWCRRMEELARQQVQYARKQYIWSCVSGILRVAVLAAVIIAILVCVPRVTAIAEKTESVLSEVQGMIGSLENIAKRLETLLSQKDTASMPGVDLSKLNEVLSKLHEAIESMPRLFGN